MTVSFSVGLLIFDPQVSTNQSLLIITLPLMSMCRLTVVKSTVEWTERSLSAVSLVVSPEFIESNRILLEQLHLFFFFIFFFSFPVKH